MAFFYTPALTLIERFIPPAAWAYAFAVLATITELVYASAYWFKQAFLLLHPGFLFALAGSLIALFTWRLTKQPLVEEVLPSPPRKNSAFWFLFILISGFIVGIILQWLVQNDDDTPQLFVMTFFIAAAMLLPAALLSQHLGYLPSLPWDNAPLLLVSG